MLNEPPTLVEGTDDELHCDTANISNIRDVCRMLQESRRESNLTVKAIYQGLL